MLCLSPQCHTPSHNVMQCSDWSDGGCRRHEERTDGAQSEEEEDGVEEIRREGQPSPVKTQLSYWQIIYHQSGILYTVNIMEICIHSSESKEGDEGMQGICGTPPTLFTVVAKLSSAVLSYERATPRLTIPPSPLRNDLSSSVVAPQRYCESDSK